MPSYSVRRARIKEFKSICGQVEDGTAESILSANNWDVQRSVSEFFDNRSKYPELKQGDTSRLKKVFRKYADSEDPEIMSENGMIKFFKDVNVDAEGIHSFIRTHT